MDGVSFSGVRLLEVDLRGASLRNADLRGADLSLSDVRNCDLTGANLSNTTLFDTEFHKHQILPGHDIYEEVDRGIRMWDKLLLCASRESLSSWWCDAEVSKAFEKERRLSAQLGRKIRVLVPLDLDGFMFEWQSGMATELRRRLAADLRGSTVGDEKWETAMEALARAMRTDEGRQEPPKSAFV